jgi:hypothetical protein
MASPSPLICGRYGWDLKTSALLVGGFLLHKPRSFILEACDFMRNKKCHDLKTITTNRCAHRMPQKRFSGHYAPAGGFNMGPDLVLVIAEEHVTRKPLTGEQLYVSVINVP